MARARKPYTIHGKPSQYGACEDAPRCPTCETGMACLHDSTGHFCGWHKCPDYVGDTLMTAYREIMQNMRNKGR